MARVLLILPTATYRAPEFLAAARRLGVDVVTASEEPQALARVMGDRFVEVTLDDPLAAAATIVGLARRVPLDAVLAVDDQGALAAAHAAEQLGLVHNPPDAVAVTRNKGEMRRRFASGGVAQPDFRIVGEASVPLIDDVLSAAEEIGYPVVIKPVGLSGSRGVIRADDDRAAAAAFGRIGRILDSIPESERTLVVESFISGPEVAVEGLLVDGVFHCLAIFDKPDPLEGPFFEETIYVTPSRHPQPVLAATVAAMGTACAALGLREGPVHGEARLGTGATPMLLELAARTIGGRCAAALRFATGVTLEEIVLRHALGHPQSDVGTARAAGVMMLPIPHSGRLVAVTGRQEALATPGVVALEVAIPPGQQIAALPEGSRYLGFLFAEGPIPEAVEASLRSGHAKLTVEIEQDDAALAPPSNADLGAAGPRASGRRPNACARKVVPAR